MKRTIVRELAFVALFLLLAAACSRDSSKTAAPGGEGADAGGLPTVNYAEIMSNGFLSDRPVNIQFSTAEGVSQVERFLFKWYVDGIVVDTAAGTVLEPQFFRKGSKVEAEVIPIDGQRLGKPFRTKAVLIKNSPPAMTAASLRPEPVFAGDTISVAAEAADKDGDEIQYQYQWYVNNSLVPGGEGGSFPTTGLKKNDAVNAVVTPYDGEDKGQPMTTGFLVLANRPPDITSAPPSGLQGNVYVYQVKAVDPDGGKLSYSLASGPQGMTIDRASGLLQWQPQAVTGRQEMSVKIAVEDDDGAVAYQEFNMNLDLK